MTAADGFLPRPVSGRIYAAARTVRATDITPAGRLRLDAIARYLQDAAEDDVADAGLREPTAWLLRRCALRIRSYPGHRERIELRTFCSALGPRWAERTTTITAGGSDIIQARAIWVAVSGADGAPVALGKEFRAVYAESAQGRRATARLFLPMPPANLPARPWQLRASDFDTAGHVNNTVHWAALEDVLGAADWAPAGAELEYRLPVLPGTEPGVAVSRAPGQAGAWLTNGEEILAAARMTAGQRPD